MFSGDLWWSAVSRGQLDSVQWLIKHKIGLDERKALESIAVADNVEAFKLWASASSNVKKMSENLIYTHNSVPKIFDHLFDTKSNSFVNEDDQSPRILFVLTERFPEINHRSHKIKTAIEAGVPINILNRESRKTALDLP